MKMMIYQIELNNGECVFSNKRDETIDKINYIIEKNKYNYVKKITLAVLDRLINVPTMTNPVIKKAKKTLIQDYYKDDIKYFIENDKKTRTDKALEKVISRLVIKLYSIEEARIHNDYDLYVKEQKRLQTTEHKDNKIIDNKLDDTDKKIIDVNINDKNIDADTDNKIIHNNNEIDTFNNVKTINKIDTAEIEPNNNNIEPNNNELVKSINEVENNFNEIDTKEYIDTTNNDIDTEITTNKDEIDTNTEIEPLNHNVEPKQENNDNYINNIRTDKEIYETNKEVDNPFTEIDNTDDTITEINDIDKVKKIHIEENENHASINNHDVENLNPNENIENNKHVYFNPSVNSEKFNRNKLINQYNKKDNNKTLHAVRDDVKRKNKTIKRYKISKKNAKEINKINKIMKKYGTLEKLIKSIDSCNTTTELSFIMQLYQDLYEKECAERLNNAVYTQLLHQEELINGIRQKRVIPNRTILNQE